MSTKWAVISSLALFFILFAVGIAISVSMVGQPGANRRAEMLGQGMGTMLVIGLGGIWIAWAAQRAPKKPARSSKRSRGGPLEGPAGGPKRRKPRPVDDDGL